MVAHYKIGTRDSLLAVTQTTLIKEELEKKTGCTFELVTMKTEGDLLTQKPLWQLDGKNFFTKELDEALLANKVDLVVSSYKDLGSQRPDGIRLAAVTKRFFANDILLIKQSTIDKLSSLRVLKIGTSSPRRITNLTTSLKQYLPYGKQLELEIVHLRGNVNTRISKLQDDQYDAIILAFAGLERLAQIDESNRILIGLLENLNFMILPQQDFPSAPAQGSLAIECRSDDSDLFKVLQQVHDKDTADEIAHERNIFCQFGGGCHLAIGVFAKKSSAGLIEVVKGEHNNKEYNSKRLLVKRSFSTSHHAFIGISKKDDNVFSYDQVTKKRLSSLLIDYPHVLVSSKFCIKAISSLYKGTIWASGNQTAKHLAQAGFWVAGSCESLGEQLLLDYLKSKALKSILPAANVKVLTSEESTNNCFEKIAVYQRQFTNLSEAEKNHLRQINVFFWSSFDQYLHYVDHLPEIKDRTHACGIGKTYQKFCDHNVAVMPFLNVEEFKHWFKKELV